MNEQSNINPNSQSNGVGQAPTQPVTPQNQGQPVQQPATVSPAPQPVQAAPLQQTPVQQAPIQATPVQQTPIQNEVVQSTQPNVEVVLTPQTSVPSENVSGIPTPQVAQTISENIQQPVMPQQPQVITEQQSTPVMQTPMTSEIQQNQVTQPEIVQTPVQPVAPTQPVTPEQNISNVPNNGVFGPSVPLNGVNATDIGFVAASTEMPKKKKKGPVIAIIIIILIALAVLGYFVIYPFIMKTYFSNPKNVYEASIKTAVKNLSGTTNDLVHNKAIYDIEASFDSNIETLKDYTGYSYNVNFGVDPVKKTIQEGIAIKDLSSNAEHSYYYYIKDDKAYERYSSYRGYIYKGEVDPEQTKDIFSLFSNDELFDNANKLSSEDINYLIEKFSQLLVDSIDESKLSKSDSSITLDGKTIKVTDNKYEIDYTTMVNTVNFVIDGIVKDEKSLELISKMYEVSEDDLKKALEESKITDDSDEEIIDRSGTITTSIYTYGTKNDIVGFGLVDSDEEVNFHYYFNENYYEAVLKVKTENKNTGKMEDNNIEVIGKKNGNSTKVSVKYNDKEVATFDIKQWDEKGINFDYSLITDEDTITGSFKFVTDINDERAKFSLEVSVKMGKEYINVSLSVSEDWTSEVANINTDSAVQLTDEELKKQQDEFMNALKDTPVGPFITTISGDYDPTIKDYYDNDNNINMIDPVPENPDENGNQNTDNQL